MDFQPMSPEEMQRTMQFVLHQQAQFAVDFAKLTEKTDRIAEGSTRISDGLIGLTTIVSRLAAAQLRTDEELREQRGQLKEQRDLLEEQRKHIYIVIEMFERHLRDDHGQSRHSSLVAFLAGACGILDLRVEKTVRLRSAAQGLGVFRRSTERDGRRG